MAVLDIVRFRVKLGRADAFVEAQRRADPTFRWFLRGALVEADERAYCIVGELDSIDSLVSARPKMIGLLDTFRSNLEDFGNGSGVTDPVSGEVVLDMRP